MLNYQENGTEGMDIYSFQIPEHLIVCYIVIAKTRDSVRGSLCSNRYERVKRVTLDLKQEAKRTIVVPF